MKASAKAIGIRTMVAIRESDYSTGSRCENANGVRRQHKKQCRGASLV